MLQNAQKSCKTGDNTTLFLKKVVPLQSREITVSYIEVPSNQNNNNHL
jgi:hypothetical protein